MISGIDSGTHQQVISKFEANHGYSNRVEVGCLAPVELCWQPWRSSDLLSFSGHRYPRVVEDQQ